MNEFSLEGFGNDEEPGFYKKHLMPVLNEDFCNSGAAFLKSSRQFHFLCEKICQEKSFMLRVRIFWLRTVTATANASEFAITVEGGFV